MLRSSFVVVVAAACVQCGGVDIQEVPRPNFDPAIASYALETGATEVIGSAFARQRGGGVVSCAGNDVWLLPDEPFFAWVVTPVVVRVTESALSLSGGGSSTTREWPIATRLRDTMQYARRSQCDIDGRFRFSDVPRGQYIVATVILWEVGRSQQGGAAVEAFTIADNTPTIEVTVQL
jgi:hypothetical protein